MSRTYSVELDGERVGYTHLEWGDPPMGVVGGRVHFENAESPYEMLSAYCQRKGVAVHEEDPKIGFISTQSVEGLRVYSSTGTEIVGLAASLSGYTEEGFEIEIIGIAYPFYAEEFRVHCDAYENK